MLHLIKRVFLSSLAKSLEVDYNPRLPVTVSDELVLTKSIDTTFPYVDLLFKSVTGAVAANDIELPATPAGQLEYPIEIELSHTDPIARPVQFGIRWPRGGVITSVALVSQNTISQFFVIALPRAERLDLPPDARIYAASIGNAQQLVLKMCYVTVPLGDSLPG